MGDESTIAFGGDSLGGVPPSAMFVLNHSG